MSQGDYAAGTMPVTVTVRPSPGPGLLASEFLYMRLPAREWSLISTLWGDSGPKGAQVAQGTQRSGSALPDPALTAAAGGWVCYSGWCCSAGPAYSTAARPAAPATGTTGYAWGRWRKLGTGDGHILFRPSPYLGDDTQDPSDPLCSMESAGVGAHGL